MNFKICPTILSAVMLLALSGCSSSTEEVLTDEEREINAVKKWFESYIEDEDNFSDLADYEYYARTIGLEMDGLLTSDMWEIYYSEDMNINKDIDKTAIYLIRLNPDKLLETWAKNNEVTADEICEMMGTSRDDFYFNFGYTSNSINYSKNHKNRECSYSELEEKIFGKDNGENRVNVFSTHFLKISTDKYSATYESEDESLQIQQRDLLKSTTKSKKYDLSDYTTDELTGTFKINDVSVRRILTLDIPSGYISNEENQSTLMFNMSPFSYGCTLDDLVDITESDTEETTSETLSEASSSETISADDTAAVAE